MKPTNTNNRTDYKDLNGRAASLRRQAPALVALGALLALVFLNGCASPSGASDNFEPNQYNPATGYPAVGGGTSWH